MTGSNRFLPVYSAGWCARTSGQAPGRTSSRLAKHLAGRPAGRSYAAPVSSAAPKKKHLIEAAPFGRLDQILSASV